MLGIHIIICSLQFYCIRKNVTSFAFLYRHSGTPAVMCAHKQASGFLYPLEKGFVYVHKPPMYIRFEEVLVVILFQFE